MPTGSSEILVLTWTASVARFSGYSATEGAFVPLRVVDLDSAGDRIQDNYDPDNDVEP